jgi:hypothetical protein
MAVRSGLTKEPRFLPDEEPMASVTIQLFGDVPFKDAGVNLKLTPAAYLNRPEHMAERKRLRDLFVAALDGTLMREGNPS